MTSALRASLEARGVRLALVDGRVRVTAAAGTLTDADRAALGAQRDALLALLQAETKAPAESDWLTSAAAAVAITRALASDGRGGIVITARALDGTHILLVRDKAVAVPEKYRGLVRFTSVEVEQIVAERWPAQRLRDVVMVKDVMAGGTVVPPMPDDRMQAPCAVHRPAAAPATLADHQAACEERQEWLYRGFPHRGPEDP